MHRKILAHAFGIVLATLAVAPANATLITSGVIEVVTPSTGRFNFDFTIDGVSVVGHTDEGSKFLTAGYEGEVFNGNQNRGIQDMFWGFVGDDFVSWREGSLGPLVTAFNTTAAGSVLTAGQTLYQSAFDFSGALCGIYSGSFGTPCDVTFPSLTGQGIAEFLFNESVLDDGRHYFTPVKATYTFLPVPEPSAVALFGLGLLGVALARRSKRAASQVR